RIECLVKSKSEHDAEQATGHERHQIGPGNLVVVAPENIYPGDHTKHRPSRYKYLHGHHERQQGHRDGSAKPCAASEHDHNEAIGDFLQAIRTAAKLLDISFVVVRSAWPGQYQRKRS